MIIVTIYCLADRLSDNLQYINKCETSVSLWSNPSFIRQSPSADPEGDRGSEPPPPLENHKLCGFH